MTRTKNQTKSRTPSSHTSGRAATAGGCHPASPAPEHCGPSSRPNADGTTSWIRDPSVVARLEKVVAVANDVFFVARFMDLPRDRRAPLVPFARASVICFVEQDDESLRAAEGLIEQTVQALAGLEARRASEELPAPQPEKAMDLSGWVATSSGLYEDARSAGPLPKPAPMGPVAAPDGSPPATAFQNSSPSVLADSPIPQREEPDVVPAVEAAPSTPDSIEQAIKEFATSAANENATESQAAYPAVVIDAAGRAPAFTGKESEAHPTWSEQIEWVDPGTLSDHPCWLALVGFMGGDSEAEFREFVRKNPALTPLIVTGERCASGPGVIVHGHEYRRAAMDARLRLIPVIRRTDLTADAEEILIIKLALAGAHAPRFAPSKLAALEAKLFELYGRQRGHRSDLEATILGPNGRPIVGDTIDVVAAETGRARNAVANRRKVFASPASPQFLRDAVDREEMSLTRAAELVREMEAQEDVRAALKSDDEHAGLVEQRSAVVAARATLETKAREELGRPKGKPPTKFPDSVTCKGTVKEGVLHGEIDFRGRATRVEVRGTEITLMMVKKARSRRRRPRRSSSTGNSGEDVENPNPWQALPAFEPLTFTVMPGGIKAALATIKRIGLRGSLFNWPDGTDIDAYLLDVSDGASRLTAMDSDRHLISAPVEVKAASRVARVLIPGQNAHALSWLEDATVFDIRPATRPDAVMVRWRSGSANAEFASWRFECIHEPAPVEREAVFAVPLDHLNAILDLCVPTLSGAAARLSLSDGLVVAGGPDARTVVRCDGLSLPSLDLNKTIAHRLVRLLRAGATGSARFNLHGVSTDWGSIEWTEGHLAPPHRVDGRTRRLELFEPELSEAWTVDIHAAELRKCLSWALAASDAHDIEMVAGEEGMTVRPIVRLGHGHRVVRYSTAPATGHSWGGRFDARRLITQLPRTDGSAEVGLTTCTNRPAVSFRPAAIPGIDVLSLVLGSAL